MSEQIIGVVTALALALVIPWYVIRKSKDAEAYSVWQSRFFQKLDSLIDNKETPGKLVEVALFFGEHMRDAKLLRRFVWALLSGGLRSGKGPKATAKIAADTPSERVLDDFAALFVAWMHALSHLSVIHGILFRNIMFPLFKKMNGDEGTVEEAVVRPYCEAAMSVTKSTFPGGMMPA